MIIDYLQQFVHPDADKLPHWTPASTADVLSRTFVRDHEIILIFILFFWSILPISKFLMNKFSNTFRKFSEEKKDEFAVRLLAVVSSIMSFRTAYLFLSQARNFPSDVEDLYATVPGMKLQNLMATAYFAVDTFACIRYGWGLTYIAHGVTCTSITYLACWPCGDRYSGYYSGPFEITPFFIHFGGLLNMLNAAPTLAHLSRVCFAVSFLVIRPIFGTYYAVKLTQAAYKASEDNWAKAHHPFAICYTVAVIWFLMILQYIWTKPVVEGILEALGIIDTKPDAVVDIRRDDNALNVKKNE